MSRVHDALRRAEQMLDAPLGDAPAEQAGMVRKDGLPDGAKNPYDDSSLALATENRFTTAPDEVDVRGIDQLAADGANLIRRETRELQVDWRSFLSRCATIPFKPAPEAHLIGPDGIGPSEGPAEEFRSLRTRLNHMQSTQDLHCILVTSASPA